jgi:hypothetical protein
VSAPSREKYENGTSMSMNSTKIDPAPNTLTDIDDEKLMVKRNGENWNSAPEPGCRLTEKALTPNCRSTAAPNCAVFEVTAKQPSARIRAKDSFRIDSGIGCGPGKGSGGGVNLR